MPRAAQARQPHKQQRADSFAAAPAVLMHQTGTTALGAFQCNIKNRLLAESGNLVGQAPQAGCSITELDPCWPRYMSGSGYAFACIAKWQQAWP